MLYEMHSHTPLCKHAQGEPHEYAEVAVARGLSGYTITCHNPMPDGFSEHVRMSADEFPEYVKMVEKCRRAWDGRLDVQLGLEADYFPGFEDWLRQQLQSADFHYVLGSIHPQLHEFRRAYWTGDPLEYQRTYFRMLAECAETGLFDCLAHPDLVKNETARDWDPEPVMEAICAALDRIAATGIAMELNTSGTNKRIAEMNPFPGMLREMQARGIPVVVGSDAHVPERTGDQFIAALDLLRDCGYSQVHIFRERQPVALDIDAARESLLSCDQSA